MNLNPRQLVDLSSDVKKIFENISTDLRTINENIIITHENQVEIGHRLARIEKKLGLSEWQEVNPPSKQN